VLTQFKNEHKDEVRLIYRHFPLNNIHDKAALAAQSAEAAGKQDKFWEMHDLLYGNASTWSGLSVVDFKTYLVDAATNLGLDKNQFAEDLESEEIVAIVSASYDKALELKLSSTPSFVVNGMPYRGGIDANVLNLMLEIVRLEDQYSTCPEFTIDVNADYYATIVTEKGEIKVQLYPNVAPVGVNNFVFLAQSGYYDGATFHRVIKGFMAQGGDPLGLGFGAPGYEFANEVSDDYKFDRAGLLAYANKGPDSNGSQFFITYEARPDLDGGYTLFGEVIEGMDVVNALTPRDPSQSNTLPPGDEILRIEITVEK